MRIATGRKTLEVVAPDPPGLTQLGGRHARVELAAVDIAHDRCNRVRFAGETRIAQSERLEARAPAVTCVDIADGCPVVEGHAAGGQAERGGNVDGAGDCRSVVAAQFGKGNRGSEGTIRAVRMDGQARLRCPPDPGAGLVGQDHRLQEACAGEAAHLGFRQCCRQELDAGVRPGAQVAFVEVVPGAGGAIDERGSVRGEALACSKHGGHRIAAVDVEGRQAPHLRHHSACHHAPDAVGQDQPAAGDDVGGDVGKPCRGDKLGQLIGCGHKEGPLRCGRAILAAVVIRQ